MTEAGTTWMLQRSKLESFAQLSPTFTLYLRKIFSNRFSLLTSFLLRQKLPNQPFEIAVQRRAF